jgi:NADPH-dependent curcumin reductase
VPLSTVGAAVADGRIRYREDIIDGLENALAAFIGMLEGRNFGKALVGRFKCIGRPL